MRAASHPSRTRQPGGRLNAVGDGLRRAVRSSGRLVHGDAPQVHRAAAIARKVDALAVRRPHRRPVERRILRHRARARRRRRDGVDVPLAAGIAPVDDAIAGRGPRRLRGVTVDDLARRAAGRSHHVQRAVAKARGRVDDLFGRERDVLAVRRPGRMKSDVGHPPHGFAGGAGDEDASVGVGLMKRDRGAIRRNAGPPSSRCGSLMIGARCGRRPAGVDVPAAVHANRVRDRGAVGRKAGRCLLAGQLADAGEVTPSVRRGSVGHSGGIHERLQPQERDGGQSPRQPRATGTCRARLASAIRLRSPTVDRGSGRQRLQRKREVVGGLKSKLRRLLQTAPDDAFEAG